MEDRRPVGTPVLVLDDLSYEIEGFRLGPISIMLESGEILSIIGPNGAGKTTLLRIVSGLEEPLSGAVKLRGRDVTRLPAHRRDVGFVFQDLALFPHMTVKDNIAYGLTVRGLSVGEMERRVAGLLSDFGISALAGRLPRELSGGERQRVAIARSLAPDPNILLLDEPLNAVDPENRRNFQSELRALLRERHVTAIIVTHDLDEGAFLSDRMAVMMGGSIAQTGPSSEVLWNPGNEAIASFLGYNIWREGDKVIAAHPMAMTIIGDLASARLKGRIVRVSTTAGGVNIDAELERGKDLVRIELDRQSLGKLQFTPGDHIGINTTHATEFETRK